MPPSPGLAFFRQQYFGPVDHYLGWHDGYEADTTCLDRLAPAERAQAETELLANLQTGTADPRTLLGLGYLRSRAALPLLHDYLLRTATYALGAIAQTDPAALDQARLLQALRAKASEFQLTNVLVGIYSHFQLAQLSPAVAEQLLALLAHPDYLVRYHALAGLRRLHRLPTAGFEYNFDSTALRQDEAFGLISKDGHPARYRQAQRLLTQEIAAGRSR